MKEKNEINRILRTIKPYLEKEYNVKELGLFGSYVREEQTQESDADILIEFRDPVGWEFVEIKDFIENKLELKIDLITPRGLRSIYKNKVLTEVEYV